MVCVDVQASCGLGGVQNQGDTAACSGYVVAALCACGGVASADPRAIYTEALEYDGKTDVDGGVPLVSAVRSVQRRGVPTLQGGRVDAPPLVAAPNSVAHLQEILTSGRAVAAVICLTERVRDFFGEPAADNHVLRDAGRAPRRDDSGHAILIVGCSDVGGGSFLARSSWTSGWGWQGGFFIPYAALPLLEQLYTLHGTGTGWSDAQPRRGGAALGLAAGAAFALCML